MQFANPQFLLDTLFHKFTHPDGDVIYWRDCVVQPEWAAPGSQGYQWVFSDGESVHSYRTPEMVYPKG